MVEENYLHLEPSLTSLVSPVVGITMSDILPTTLNGEDHGEDFTVGSQEVPSHGDDEERSSITGVTIPDITAVIKTGVNKDIPVKEVETVTSSSG